MTVAIVPSLLARDLAATRRFYRMLGFVVSGGDGAEEWLELRRGDAVIQFYIRPPHDTPTAPCLSGALYISSHDVDSLAEQLRDKVAVEWGPETMHYGMRELAVRDPNGYLIAFTAPASP
jgi:catechol 2,3-dioxygenase-like lactoylglutathione lyase family enzyme